MAARKQKGARSGRSKAGSGRSASPKALALIGRALQSYLRAFPIIALVGLAGAVPLQLSVTWLMERQGIAGDATWEMRYQGFADWIFGSLIAASLYFAVHRSISERASALQERTGWIALFGSSYRRGLSVWLGMWLTRMMFSFAITIPALPLLGGLYLVSQKFPVLGRLMTDPEAASSVTPEMVFYVLLLLPLFLLPLYFYLRYSLAECVVALERLDGFQALRRSRSLTDGAKWKLLAGVVLLDCPLLVVGLVLEGLAAEASPWTGALATAFSVTLVALSGTFLVHVYLAQGGDAVDRRRVDRKPGSEAET